MTEDRAMPSWLEWAREIQSLCQTGLAFSRIDYDIQRYRRLMEIAAAMMEAHTGQDRGEVLLSFMAHPGYATPKVDVRGAVVREGRILLVQERTDGRWAMPGGWADVGEVPSAMVSREVWEESGLVVEPRKVLGIFDANRVGRPLEFFHAYKVIFLCEIVGGEAQPGEETLDVRFFDFEALPPLSIHRTNEMHLAEVRAHLGDPLRPAAFD